VTLDEVPGDATVTLVEGTPTIQRRLAEMGVRVGSHIAVLYRTTGGGRVLSVDGARIAIDAGLAGAIHAEPDHG
jgi:Fe2+ transport system protein FeoA